MYCPDQHVVSCRCAALSTVRGFCTVHTKNRCALLYMQVRMFLIAQTQLSIVKIYNVCVRLDGRAVLS